jgi:signal transduction histidine kinase
LRLARVQEIEKLRLRIAADLHDEVGSSLWSISLLSRMLQKQDLQPEQKKDASEINRIAVQTANSIRDIVWFINPEYDTLQDLLLRMKDVAGTSLAGLEVDFQQTQENPARKLPLNFRQNVFLMFKEILANIVKHSHATRVEIKVSETGQLWTMRISDNGRGFDPAQAHNGNGLKNLRRRAEKLGAKLEIVSEKGGGTRITIMVPAL